jgi:hypothetical protein
MRLSGLTELATSRDVVEVFGGYNHNLRIANSEFYDMKNLTSDEYPVLSTRNKRGVVKQLDSCKGITAKGKLAYVEGKKLIYGDYVHEIPELTDGDKQLVSFGAYLIIFPDGIQYNTQTDEWEHLEAHYKSSGEVKFEMCNIESSAYEYTSGPTAPAEENGKYWLDTSSSPHSLKVYSSTSQMWSTVPTCYVKISALGIDEHFELYDGIEISGCTAPGTSDLNSTMVIWGKGEGYITVIGVLDHMVTQEDVISVDRSIPTMDFITESENRLWGCHYGIIDGKPVNEIYACKLGDAKNWNCFMGISSDSYAVSLGSDGVFTGAITHLGHPLFFKENCIHKIYGNLPSNYQVSTTNCRGVQRGSEKSLAIVNEVILYKSAVDVCAYDGSLPTSVSDNLGSVRYFEAVAGSIDGKYYISMRDAANEWNLFVFDTIKNMWHKEDNTHIKGFCTLGTDLYLVTDDNALMTTTGTGETKESKIKWFAETGSIGYSYPDNKYLSKLNVRMTLNVDSSVALYIQYDSFGEWERKWSMNGVGTRSFTIPIIPKRCDHFKIRFEGEGDCRIFSIAKMLEMGSDV